MEKVNRNLEENLQKYSIMLSNEKSEKKDWIEKFDQMNNRYLDKIEEFSLWKIRQSRVVFGLLALLGMVVVAGVVYWWLGG